MGECKQCKSCRHYHVRAYEEPCRWCLLLWPHPNWQPAANPPTAETEPPEPCTVGCFRMHMMPQLPKPTAASITADLATITDRAVAGVGRVLAMAHWGYTRDLLIDAGVEVTKLHETLYTSALEHGYKHGREHGREDENANQEGE